MSKSKIFCLTLTAVLLVVLLAGCGAKVSTVMEVSTENGGFAGSRVITLTIANEDLEQVTGGLTALETVLTENLPEQLSYAITAPSETETVITFTLAFTSMDEYKTKVAALLALDSENTVTPEIEYAKNDSVFCKGLKYVENFQSFDLLRWYFNALQSANIIAESTSNWYELGEDSLIIDGVTLDTYGHQFNYDETEENYLDDCQVTTVMNLDGSFDRTIVLSASKYTLADLEAVTEDFAGYMQALAPEGVSYTAQTDEDGYYTHYTYTMHGVSAQALQEHTDAILQTQGNRFTVIIAPKEGVPGKAVVTIEEVLDGAYCLDAEYDSIRSTIITYPNFTLTQGEASTNYGQSEISYYAHMGQTNTLTGDWVVGFEKAQLELSAASWKKLTAKLHLTVPESLPEEIREIALSALQSACSGGEYKLSGNTATCTFTGSPEALDESLDAFVRYYTQLDGDYCTVELAQMQTASNFTNGVQGSFTLELQPVLGSRNIYLTATGGMEMVSGVSTDENGSYTESNMQLQFISLRLDWLTLLGTVFSGLLILAGAVWAYLHRAGFAQWLDWLKTRKERAEQAKAAAPVLQTQTQVWPGYEEDEIL